MSYQPDPPAGAQPTSPFGVPTAPPPPPPVAMQYPTYGPGPVPPVGAAAPVPAQRRKGLMFTGIAIAVLGIGAGVVLIALSGSAEEETIKRFARAPVGCTTTLEFDKTATFTMYIETKGSIGAVDGDCGAGGTTYQRSDADLPRVSLTLLNASDEEASLTAVDSPSYAEGDFAGQAHQSVDITEPGTYRLTVTSDDTDFAIAIGGKPDTDAEAMSLAGVGAAAIGVLLGGLLLLLGLRKRKSTPPAPPTNGSPAMWQPTPAPVPGWQPQAAVPGAYPAAAPVPFTPAPPNQTAPSAPTTQSTPTAPSAPTAPPGPGPTGPGWGAPQQ